MRAKDKGDVHIPPEPVTVEEVKEKEMQMPYWDPQGIHNRGAYRTITETKSEHWNHAWVEGARVRSMDEMIRKQNMLISLAAAVGLIQLAIGILLIAHLSMS